MSKKIKRLREEAEKALDSAYKNFIIARAVPQSGIFGRGFDDAKTICCSRCFCKNIMSVNVPVFDFKTEDNQSDIYPYGLAFTSGELDSAMESFPLMLCSHCCVWQKVKKQHSF